VAAALAVLARVTGALPGGEVRPGQQRMCAGVADAIEQGVPAVFRAPTGSGKSAAYLAACLAAREPVVVATASIALQDQLATKDVPHVVAHAGLVPPPEVAVLKGRANYVCRARLAERERAAQQGTLDLAATGATAKVRDDLAAITAWAQSTITGDRAELATEPDPEAWRQVSVGGDECPGASQCPHGGSCFAERATATAREADLIVVSTHLYALHLAIGGYLLPDHRVVVFDEVHEVESIVSQVLGVSITPGRLRWLATSARNAQAGERPALDAVVAASSMLEEALAPLDGQRLDPSALPDPVVAAITSARDSVNRLVESARKSAAAADTSRAAASGAAAEAKAAALRIVKSGGQLVTDLDRPAAPGVDAVVFVEGSSLRVAPLDVASTLRTMLWDEGVVGIGASATIDDRLPARLGMSSTTVVDIESTFDVRRNGLLYVPRLPDPRHADWEAAAHDELAELIAAAGGRTLALFTSWARTRAAAAALRPRISTPVLVQGEAPRAQLLAGFVQEEAASLFATTSFWQGVDAPGRTCVLVTLDRLPFPRPDEPIVQALRERAGDRAFDEVDLPRTATMLAQGVGRLLRTADDRGVVAVLDRRLAEAGYRRAILDAVPRLRRTRERSEAVAFLCDVTG
jgi:ATP-dependent DNA helicase DinG